VGAASCRDGIVAGSHSHRGLHYRQDGVARHNLLPGKSLPKTPQPLCYRGRTTKYAKGAKGGMLSYFLRTKAKGGRRISASLPPLEKGAGGISFHTVAWLHLCAPFAYFVVLLSLKAFSLQSILSSCAVPSERHRAGCSR